MGDRVNGFLHRDILVATHIRFYADDRGAPQDELTSQMTGSDASQRMNREVDRWLDEANHPLDATMRRAREIILGADDRVTESIKWKTPTFAYKGNIASFNPSKNVVSIMFHRGSEIPGDHPRLEGDGKLVRTMRFTDLDDLEASRTDLEAAVRAWCEWKAGPSSPH
jgi:hypothetical protein